MGWLPQESEPTSELSPVGFEADEVDPALRTDVSGSSWAPGQLVHSGIEGSVGRCENATTRHVVHAESDQLLACQSESKENRALRGVGSGRQESSNCRV